MVGVKFKKGQRKHPASGRKKGVRNKKTLLRAREELERSLTDHLVADLLKHRALMSKAVERLHRKAAHSDDGDSAFKMLMDVQMKLMDACDEKSAVKLAVDLGVFAELEEHDENLSPEAVQAWVLKYAPVFAVNPTSNEWFMKQGASYYTMALNTTMARLTARNSAPIEKVHRVIRIMHETTKTVTASNVDQYLLWMSLFKQGLEAAGLSDWTPRRDDPGKSATENRK